MRVAVAGGTGTVGRLVVAALTERGHQAPVLSRSAGVDLITGTGLPGALAGADAVVDVVNASTTSAAASTQFFSTTSRQLLAAEAAAGVGHHLLLSIVGIDRSPTGYYAGKVAQERVVESGTVPWTILRATQFHEFAAQLLPALRRGPLTVVPKMRTQPVAAREVADRLVDLVSGEPSGHVADLGGPQEERLAALVRGLAKRSGLRGPTIEIPLPGPGGRAMRDGSLLPGPDADRGIQTYAGWLATQDAPEAGRPRT